MLHGLPIGWRHKKVQKPIESWRPVKSDPPKANQLVLFACEWSDCGWLIDTGWMDEKGQCWKGDSAGKFSPDYWMPQPDTKCLEQANYGKK